MGRGDGDLNAELVRLVGLALVDAFDFARMQGKYPEIGVFRQSLDAVEVPIADMDPSGEHHFVGERPVSRFWSGAELAQVTSQMIHL
jgi:hypothetical protein